MKVIVYSTKTCPWCVVAKNYLTDNNVEFEAFNVEEDESKAQEMIEKSGQMGVPVIDIDGTIIQGFKKEEIDKLIKGE